MAGWNASRQRSLILGICCAVFQIRCSTAFWVTPSYRRRRSKVCGLAASPTAGDPSGDCLPRVLRWNLDALLQVDDNAAAKAHLQQIHDAAINRSEPEDYKGPLSPELELVRRFLQTYPDDGWGQNGRFLAPTQAPKGEYSLPANLVFSMDSPLDYIRDVLSIDPLGRRPSEVVVCLLGADGRDNLGSSARQLQFLSRVLDGMPLALLHIGTSHRFDNDEAAVELTQDTLQALKSLHLILGDDHIQESDVVRIRKHDVNLLRTLMVDHTSSSDDLAIAALVRLIDVAVMESTGEKPNLVLFSCGTTAFLLGAAIKQWRNSAMASHQHSRTEREVEVLLRQALTVVTVGALGRYFPKGPAYIHISIYDDALATEYGPKDDEGEAVVLHGFSPYTSQRDKDGTNKGTDSLHANDARNIHACAIQFLSLVLRLNGLTTFRQLYEAGRQPTPKLDIPQSLYALNYDDAVGDLEMPQDELLIAMIQTTGAECWLWNADTSALPEPYEAEAIMTEHFGYDVYDEISANCQMSH